MALGKNIERARKAKGFSQAHLSKLTGWSEENPDIGISQGAISVLEVRDSKSSKFAPALAKALEVPIGELISGEIKIKQPTGIYTITDTVLEDLAVLPQEDAEVWKNKLAEIEATLKRIKSEIRAAAKACRLQMEKSDRKDAAKAPDPPLEERRA